MNVFGKFGELLRLIFRTETSNVEVTLKPQDSGVTQTLTLPNSAEATDVLTSRQSDDSGANRLQNKDLDSSTTAIVDSGDTTKQVQLDVSGITTATTRTLTVQDSDDVIVGRATTDTLTNKSVDADNNTITNLETDNLKAGVLTTTVSGGSTDTELPSALAVETRVGVAETSLNDHITDATDAHAASAITNTPAGGVAATTVQAAIDELDSEKVSKAGDTMTGNLTMSGADIDLGTGSITDVGSVELEDTATVDSESSAGIIDIGGTNADEVRLGRTGQTTVIRGDLDVQGTTTTVNTDVLDVEDANITVNVGGDQATANTEVAGLTVEMSDATDARIGFDSTSASKFKAGESGSESPIVTESATQTVTNKVIDADNNTISNLAHGAEVDDPSSGVHGVAGSVVGTTDAQALTNKTIDGDLNTISNLAHGAEVDDPSSGVHGVTGDVVGTTDTQTLSGKTLTAPVINTSLTGTAVLDEDDMVSNSDTQVSTQQAIKAYVDASVAGASGSGAGEINYVSNGVFASNADDWFTYASAATPVPANTAEGVSPSSDITITRATDFIIEGAASGKLSKINANSVTGHGIATDFTIPAGQLKQEQKIQFRFKANDQTFWQGNLRVYIVQNNATLLTPDLEYVSIPVQSGNDSALYTATFTPSATLTSYRLLIHIESDGTSGSTSEIWIDSVVVGPEEARSVPREGVTNLIRINDSDEPGTWYKFDAVSAPTTYAQFDPSNTGFTTIQKVTTDYLRGPFGTEISWFSSSSQFTGIQTQFSLPKYLETRLCAIEFDYLFTTVSGSRVTGDVEVYLVGEDDTMIQLDDLTIPASAGSVQNYRATAVLGVEQKWRLAVMCNSAALATDEFIIDNVYVGVGAPGVVQAPIAADGEYGVVTYEEASVTLVNSGSNNMNGTLYCTRVGRTVTITWDSSITHASSSFVQSAAGEIPAAFRPSATIQYNIYVMSATEICRVGIEDGGEIQFYYSDFTGTGTNETNSVSSGSITYSIN